MEYSTVNLIQSMLAPGLMISACGLLLLTTNNKYSFVVDRIRLLNEEKRQILWGKNEKEISPEEKLRLQNVMEQLQLFFRRIGFIRNAVLSYTVAVVLFIITSILIGLTYIFTYDLSGIALLTFLFGMLSVLIGSIYMAREIVWGYRIVEIEIKSV